MDKDQVNKMDKNTFKDGFIVEEKEDKTIRRFRKCKACKRPVIGHVGKFGVGKCTYKTVADQEEVTAIVKSIMEDSKYEELKNEDKDDDIDHEVIDDTETINQEQVVSMITKN